MTLSLLPITPDLDFGCHNYQQVSDILMDVINSTVAMENTPPWCGYLAITDSQEVVGTCAFKGPPDESGVVELAWFTFPAYENKGYGTAMTRELVDLAKNTGQTTELIAHTLPEKNASTRICEKCGFTMEGEVIDPEDGPVWRWKQSGL